MLLMKAFKGLHSKFQVNFLKKPYNIYKSSFVSAGNIISRANSASNLFEGIHAVSIRNTENPDVSYKDHFQVFVLFSPATLPNFNVAAIINANCDETATFKPYDR